ncbi:hypothetical protein CWB96_17810 [Pseudoalteromonas citrea]|uniref:Uncharacterized protein n=1 Tax=Pseudoalteromonas citrea TaxID=43655 RepID=A0A5S3XM77_9GAMM|nr:hypothetical protein [Pseudoalteromonas citrea]TMP42272.1 hypothetical protein CWB97_12160 [Pseudoalteromonas citrea]TMP55146.1 hypothetical protein CWB96_17810 [Pseudoalteromonas citrea]
MGPDLRQGDEVGLVGLGDVAYMGPDLRQGDEAGLFGLGGVTYMGPDLRQGDEKGGKEIDEVGAGIGWCDLYGP